MKKVYELLTTSLRYKGVALLIIPTQIPSTNLPTIKIG